MTETATDGRWMRVEFHGLLPAGVDLFPGDHLDATGRLAELFGFTGIAHLTVTEALQERDAEVASSFQPGDIIAVPSGIVRITGFRETSRLRIKSFRASMKAKECKACGTAIRPGDLYASSTEPSSDRCIRCVDGWPLAR